MQDSTVTPSGSAVSSCGMSASLVEPEKIQEASFKAPYTSQLNGSSQPKVPNAKVIIIKNMPSHNPDLGQPDGLPRFWKTMEPLNLHRSD
ncbi:hypothetical protein Nepgr_024051 [Nepenthes gracilis]|uniref:Uncharacterized protein n=1 Tax=Nepenthes gracilis TaxID=150966 RepID=A0AAD3T3B8_NEPGR|nr:hypothetical protein Nepgr_024051 [Nepenthes gracilis]